MKTLVFSLLLPLTFFFPVLEKSIGKIAAAVNMKRKYRIMCTKYTMLFIILLFVSCTNSAEPEPPVNETGKKMTNMKGFEIYVWEKDQKTFYTLLPGTNRNKDSGEIYDPEKAMEWSEVKKLIDNIDTGQYVFVKPLRAGASAVNELTDYLLSRDLFVSE